MVDCGTSLSTLEVRPASILLACADGTGGLKQLTWSDWGPSTATGQGEYAVDTCDPNCAQGKEQDYQVRVSLSAVKSSAKGAYFSQAQIEWPSTPPSGVESSYTLSAPGATGPAN